MKKLLNKLTNVNIWGCCSSIHFALLVAQCCTFAKIEVDQIDIINCDKFCFPESFVL